MEASEFESLTLETLPGLSANSLTLESLIDRTGSGRQFARFSVGGRPGGIVAMHYSLERPENARFAPITEFLAGRGFPVPTMEQRLESKRLIWLDDLGTEDLVHFQDSDWEVVRRPLYEATLEVIFPLHRLAENDSEAVGFPELEAPFDAELYTWEQDYFFEHFAANFSDGSPADVDRIREAPDLKRLATDLGALPRHLIHRDFQSSNVMIRDGCPWMIDYQGMRFGLPEYDLASLLYDPYVELTGAQRDELLGYYFRLKQAAGDAESFTVFRERFDGCAAQRLMQALGAYANLGLNKGQPDFLEYIPVALARLREVAVDRATIPSLSPVLSLRNSRVA